MSDPFVQGRGLGAQASSVAANDGLLPADVASAYAAVLKAPSHRAAPFTQRWALWGGAYGGTSHTDGDAVVGSHDLTVRTAGFAAGADYAATPFTTVGFALAGGGANWSLAQGFGGGRSDAFQAGVYGKTTVGAGLSLGVGGFCRALDVDQPHRARGRPAHRQVRCPELWRPHRGRLSAGDARDRDHTLCGPTGAGLRDPDLQRDRFHRTAASASLRGSDRDGDARRGRRSLRSHHGDRSDHAADAARQACLCPRLGQRPDARSRLPGAAGRQLHRRRRGAGARFSALASSGAELRFASGWTLAAKFDGEFAAHSQTYAGTGTVRYSW